MRWIVYIYDINQRKVVMHDIFKHGSFLNDCKKALKDYEDNKEYFIEAVRRALMYYYWAKAEWEVYISDIFTPPDEGLKVDVYKQVMLNWDIFTDYIWEHKEELKDMTY